MNKFSQNIIQWNQWVLIKVHFKNYKMKNGELSEREKIELIGNVKIYGRSWTQIGILINRYPDSLKSSYNSYIKRGTISPKRGRPVEITKDIKDSVIGSVIFAPTKSNMKQKMNYFMHWKIQKIIYQYKQFIIFNQAFKRQRKKRMINIERICVISLITHLAVIG